MSKVLRHRFSGVSMTSVGTDLVRFILVHIPDNMCLRIARLELGILIDSIETNFEGIYSSQATFGDQNLWILG